jgi:two-component system KDP operon response regulator KdpE
MARKTTVLVVDDEPQIRRAVRNALTSGRLQPAEVGGDVSPVGAGEPRASVRVVEATTGRDAIDLAAAESPALIVLDLGLPDLPGIEVCREIRRWSAAPIIVLSARHADTEKVALLDSGADDYLTKPFSTIEFMARARAQLRRAQGIAAPKDDIIAFGDVTVDLQKRRVERAGELLHLTPTEWLLLAVLLRSAGRLVPQADLLHEVWGPDYDRQTNYLRVYMSSLRKKIEAQPGEPRHLITVPGVGYRFEE